MLALPHGAAATAGTKLNHQRNSTKTENSGKKTEISEKIQKKNQKFLENFLDVQKCLRL